MMIKKMMIMVMLRQILVLPLLVIGDRRGAPCDNDENSNQSVVGVPS